MNNITIHRLSLQFDADQITRGTSEQQAKQAIELINQVLQRQPFGLCAQLIATPDEIKIELSVCEACQGKGWLRSNTGNDDAPHLEIQRCDACEKFDSDEHAQDAAKKEGIQPP